MRYIRRKRYCRNIRIVFKHSVRNFRHGFTIISCRYFNIAFLIIFPYVNRISTFVFNELEILFDINIFEYSNKRNDYYENGSSYRRENRYLFIFSLFCNFLFMLIFPIIYLVFCNGCILVCASFVITCGSNSAAEF